MDSSTLCTFVSKFLDEKKATDIFVVDLRGRSSVTDYMVIASGTSSRHVVSLAEMLIQEVGKSKIKPLSVEGKTDGEWVLVDLYDVIVHLFRPETRAYYNLEKMWSLESALLSQNPKAEETHLLI